MELLLRRSLQSVSPVSAWRNNQDSSLIRGVMSSIQRRSVTANSQNLKGSVAWRNIQDSSLRFEGYREKNIPCRNVKSSGKMKSFHMSHSSKPNQLRTLRERDKPSMKESSKAAVFSQRKRRSGFSSPQAKREAAEGSKQSVVRDVFLCHSGQQKNFVRQLHIDLMRKGVSCFFDQDRQSLPLAEKFPPLIFEATETSRIALVLLSKEFIQSKWPMLELSAFFRAKRSGKNPNLKIFPIFFMISTQTLSEITQDNEDWKNLTVDEKERAEWQLALKEIRSINGLLFSEGEDEVSFRDKVVKAVRSLLLAISPITVDAHVVSCLQPEAVAAAAVCQTQCPLMPVLHTQPSTSNSNHVGIEVVHGGGLDGIKTTSPATPPPSMSAFSHPRR